MQRSFRIVAADGLIPHVEKFLAAEGFIFESEPFSPFCRRLVHEPAPLGSSLAAFFGYIYIQDRSSMLPPLALAPAPGSSVLDMAASPGGKTGFLSQLAGPAGLVLGNEPDSARLATLRANMFRCNILAAATCSWPGEKLPVPDGAWPAILLDPPCSGWGTAAKNPKTVKIWQGVKIDKLIQIQRKLLARGARALAPGGLLLYSTCTTNPAENWEQTAYATAELGLEAVPLAAFPGFVFEQRPAGLLVDGDASGAQGFYLSLLRKNGLPEKTAMPAPPCPENLISPELLAGSTFDPSLLPEGHVGVFGGKVRFLPRQTSLLPQSLRWQGALLGRWQGGRFAPAPRLRLCLPRPDPASAIVFEEPEPIKKLLAGASLHVDIKTQTAAVWWRELPLGSCTVRNGRLTAAWK